MACNNRPKYGPQATRAPICGKPLGFPSMLDLIAWDPNVYDTIVNEGGEANCGDRWRYDASGARGVLSNDMIGSASEDPFLYLIAKRKYYNQRPFNPFRIRNQHNNLSQVTFGIMSGESNYTSSELTNLPRKIKRRSASGLASTPFEYPNESNMAIISDATPIITNRTQLPALANISTATITRSSDPIAPDLTGGPMIPKSGPGSIDKPIDGYPTLPDSGMPIPDDSGGGGMPMGGEEEVLEEEMGGLGEERTYMGLTKKQAIIALIALVVAYYWWKNKKSNN